jgi:hypothetical protein
VAEPAGTVADGGGDVDRDGTGACRCAELHRGWA